MSSTEKEEHYSAVKRLYTRLFSQAEGLRSTLKQVAMGMDPEDVDRIESEVRERIRKQVIKRQVKGDKLRQSLESKAGKG